MSKFAVTVQYPYTKYCEAVWIVEADDEAQAREKAIAGEADGSLDWDASYDVGEGEAGATEIVGVAPATDDDDEGYPPRCTNPGGHVWNRTPGEADEARLAGDYANDNVRCVYCGADGDA